MAFCAFSQCMWSTALSYYCKTQPFFQRPYKFFFLWSSFLFSKAGHLACLVHFLHRGIPCSWDSQSNFLKSNQSIWTPESPSCCPLTPPGTWQQGCSPAIEASAFAGLCGSSNPGACHSDFFGGLPSLLFIFSFYLSFFLGQLAVPQRSFPSHQQSSKPLLLLRVDSWDSWSQVIQGVLRAM